MLAPGGGTVPNPSRRVEAVRPGHRPRPALTTLTNSDGGARPAGGRRELLKLDRQAETTALRGSRGESPDSATLPAVPVVARYRVVRVLGRRHGHGLRGGQDSPRRRRPEGHPRGLVSPALLKRFAQGRSWAGTTPASRRCTRPGWRTAASRSSRWSSSAGCRWTSAPTTYGLTLPAWTCWRCATPCSTPDQGVITTATQALQHPGG